MKKWEIIDECPHCYSTATCHVQAETEADARALHLAGHSEYFDGNASIAQGKITCEELTE